MRRAGHVIRHNKLSVIVSVSALIFIHYNYGELHIMTCDFCIRDTVITNFMMYQAHCNDILLYFYET